MTEEKSVFQKEKEKEYDKLVKEVSPNSNIVTNCLKAFFVGGTICTLGEALTNIYMGMNISDEDSKVFTSITLIFLSILLTGLGYYSKLGRFAGGGSSIPITGFANSVASPAIEFKKEGYILGMGAKMFIVAGPVIVYGTVTSIIVGLIYYILT